MGNIPEKIASRISDGLKQFQPIIASNKTKDVNESDTVVLIIDILSVILGFDKYNDITTEHNIRGQFCDIALKVNGKIKLLIEAKAIGIELKDNHVRQIIDYAVNEGLEWVILTNGLIWKIYKVIYTKPIQNILVGEINALELKYRAKEDIEKIYIITKEAISKSSLDEYYTQKQATNKYMIGNLLCCDKVLNTIRKDLRQIFPDIRIHTDEIKNVLLHEVIKRDLLEGEESDNAKKKIAKLARKKGKHEEVRTQDTLISEGTTNNIEKVDP